MEHFIKTYICYIKIAVLGSWLVFHFLIQLLIPIRSLYIPTAYTHNTEGEAKASSNLKPYSYLRAFRLYHNWQFFSDFKRKNIWATASINDLNKEFTHDFLLLPHPSQQLNYFQFRYMLVFLFYNLLTPLAGKHACKKLSLSDSDSVSVNTHYSEFDLNSYPAEIVIKKTTSMIECKGLIKWGG